MNIRFLTDLAGAFSIFAMAVAFLFFTYGVT